MSNSSCWFIKKVSILDSIYVSQNSVVLVIIKKHISSISSKLVPNKTSLDGYVIRVKKRNFENFLYILLDIHTYFFSFREINEIAVAEISMLPGREGPIIRQALIPPSKRGRGVLSSTIKNLLSADASTSFRVHLVSLLHRVWDIVGRRGGELFREPLMTRVLLPPCPP